MPMKGIFNQKSKNMKNNMNEFEKQILRINALEVHIKNLLKFEKQVRTFMFGIGRGEKKENHWSERKNEVNKKSKINGGSSIESFEKNQGFDLREKKLNQLTERLNKFEQTIQDEKMTEERLLNLVEQRLSEKLASHSKNQEMMQKKIRWLESQIASLMERENHQFNGYSKEEKKSQPKLEGMTVIDALFDNTSENMERLEEANVESFDSHIKMRVLALENNYLLVNEVQVGLLKEVDNLIEKCDELTKKIVETEDASIQQDSTFKTVYIDKIYLDKYEQNNNFAQLGIKSLSGALNIGATYGSNAIPKKVTEQVKEDIEKMKSGKEEMEIQQSSTEQPEDQTNESSTHVNSKPLEEDIPFTDIVIEDDPSAEENPF